ncbi:MULTISPECIES: helix-turn-helix transcriptional regulator [Geobacillus]|uniref:helix-turn-helix transcriptional regulator n=1 Tax=Geobacillus TaxID=129337 RepID=UPI00078CCFFF|nr:MULTISPECIES: helix-turn-helix transcriptional regulator [Geobacillus]NNV07533.1 XRE family transcriptional regulator [Geobacillus sp. MMMUD3]AMQ19635.1 XRE family transcriptional regulator [Geobacillus sp. JS12]MCK7605379.1 helix-turn-helix domain-containing protein [Geobacillus stearothermophilus]MED4358697.1 helix-turn-helix transcriptional regulator [Geobacillus stearothermophilus]QIZ66663.1 helix-turn-helix transcriptional regulator [Geobacillus subterraneus]
MKLERLEAVRKKYGLTCKQVAESVGISKEYYWMIENGKRRLTYDLAVKIAQVFNAHPDDIFLDSKLTVSEQK